MRALCVNHAGEKYMGEIHSSTTWWIDLGFQNIPDRKVATGSLHVYRAWGERRPGTGSTEWGTGFFSMEKPKSVFDAEMRANIVNYNNGVHFVSVFKINPGVVYWQGAIAHGPEDISTPSTQIYIDPKPSLESKLTLVKSKELLKHNTFVSSFDGNA
jgi:hypothetical protein